MVLLTRFDFAFLVAMILTTSCWKTIASGAVSISFGDRCRISTHFARLYGARCDPYLSAVNCQVRAWGPWSSPQGVVTCWQNRTRTVQTSARNGGRPCPDLLQSLVIQCSKTAAQKLLAVLNNGLGGFGSYSPGGAAGYYPRPINYTGISRRATACPGPRDIVVIVDTSGSVELANFRLALNDLSELIPLLCGYQPDIISCRAYRLAMITYGSTPKLAFDLDDLYYRHWNQEYVQDDIKTKPSYTGGYTATGDALTLAANRVLQVSHGMRSHSSKTILLLTDGNYNHGADPVVISRQLFQRYGNQLTILALGIGSGIDYEELKSITQHRTGASSFVFETESSQSFHAIVELLKRKLQNEDSQGKCARDVLAKKRKK